MGQTQCRKSEGRLGSTCWSKKGVTVYTGWMLVPTWPTGRCPINYGEYSRASARKSGCRYWDNPEIRLRNSALMCPYKADKQILWSQTIQAILRLAMNDYQKRLSASQVARWNWWKKSSRLQENQRRGRQSVIKPHSLSPSQPRS